MFFKKCPRLTAGAACRTDRTHPSSLDQASPAIPGSNHRRRVRQTARWQPCGRSESKGPRDAREAAGSPGLFLPLPPVTTSPERAAGKELGPRAPGPLQCPGPPRPRRTPLAQSRAPLRPARPGPGSGWARLGAPRRCGGCNSPPAAACAVSFVCKHPALLTLAVRATRPRGRG